MKLNIPPTLTETGDAVTLTARNRLPGVITRIIQSAVVAHLTIRLDDSHEIAATVPTYTLTDEHLDVGSRVSAHIQPADVTVTRA